MQTTLVRTAVRAAMAVLDEAGRVIVIFSGDDAGAAADEWRGAGYAVAGVEVE